MKRLFKVVHKDGTTSYFDTKAEAKFFRDLVPGQYVSRGPDHYLGETIVAWEKSNGA